MESTLRIHFVFLFIIICGQSTITQDTDSYENQFNSTYDDYGSHVQMMNSWVKIPEEWISLQSEEKSSSGKETVMKETTMSSVFDEDDVYSQSNENKFKQNNSPIVYASLKNIDDNEPFFDHAMMTNMSEHLGSHAYLRCRVKNLGDRDVSWIRRRDWHILTSGRQVYTNDERFQIIHHDGSDEWTLLIKYVQTRDQGTYECQVASSRGILSHYFNLQVLVPQAYILGAKEYHVEQGTVISLVCIIENSPRGSPQYLYWYHNNQMINYGSGVSVHTEPGIHTHSRLTVPSAVPKNSGNYTCKAANARPASVQVYVSDGDKTAAIQRQNGSRTVPKPFILFLLLIIMIHSLQQLFYPH